MDTFKCVMDDSFSGGCTPSPARLVSIILPVYRVEAYLPACLHSIVSQKLAEWELWIVEDGSPDGCAEMCDGAARADARIRVIHQRNAGLGAARNRALPYATGKYLAFVDSDDLVLPEIWEETTRLAEGLGLDMVLFSEEAFDDQTGERVENGWLRQRTGGRAVLAPIGWQALEGGLFDSCCHAHNRLVRRAFFGACRFPEDALYEDMALHIALLLRAERLGVIERPLYRYRVRTGSLMQVRDARVLDHLGVLTRVAKVLKEVRLERTLAVPFAEFQLTMVQRMARLYERRGENTEAMEALAAGNLRTVHLERSPEYRVGRAVLWVWVVLKGICEAVRQLNRRRKARRRARRAAGR